MRLNLKKAISGLTALLMVLSLAACNNSSETTSTGTSGTTAGTTAGGADADDSGTETTDTANDAKNNKGLVKMADADDPISFNVFIRDPNTAPSKDNPVLNKITELTGVTINYEFLVGDLDQKVGVMIAGGDYPDAIFAETNKFIEAGAYIPLENLIPNYENLNNHYSRYGNRVKAADGHQYVLELYDVIENPAPAFTNTGPGFYLQKAVLMEYGTVPTTVDEYFKLIEDYKATYPEIDGVKTIGFEALTNDSWRFFGLTNPPQHLMGAGNDGDLFIDLTTYKSSMYQVSDTAKSYYKKLNEMYLKGVIEPETFTQNYDQYISRLSTGAVLGMFDQYWNFQSADELLKADGRDERRYVSLPIANPGVQDSYLDQKDPILSVTGTNGLGITVNCKNPERLLNFYDWLLQQEVQDYLQWGEEGVDYTKVGDADKKFTAERRAINNDTAKKRDLTGHILWNYSPKRQGLYADGSPCSGNASAAENNAGYSEYDLSFLEAFDIDYFAQLMSAPTIRPAYYPIWSMNLGDGTPAAIAKQKLNDLCVKYYPRMVLSKDEAEYNQIWDDFVKDVESSNITPFMELIDEQVAEKMAAN